MDLLFFHWRLHRLIAVELKLAKFMPADAGQMQLYLAWLNRYERQPTEDSPLRLILCAGKSDHRIELLELEKGGIRVAEYLTELPSKELLEASGNRSPCTVRRKEEMKNDSDLEAHACFENRARVINRAI